MSNQITFQNPVNEYVSVAAPNTPAARRICEVAVSGAAGRNNVATTEGTPHILHEAIDSGKIFYMNNNSTTSPEFIQFSEGSNPLFSLSDELTVASLLEVVADNGKYYMQWAAPAFQQVAMVNDFPTLAVINVNYATSQIQGASSTTDSSLDPGEILVTTAMKHGREDGCFDPTITGNEINPNVSYTIIRVDEYSFKVRLHLEDVEGENDERVLVETIANQYAVEGACHVSRNKFLSLRFENGNKSFSTTLLPYTADFAAGQNGQALLTGSLSLLAAYTSYEDGYNIPDSRTLDIKSYELQRSWNINLTDAAEAGENVVVQIRNGKDLLVQAEIQAAEIQAGMTVESVMDQNPYPNFTISNNQIVYHGPTVLEDLSSMLPEVYYNSAVAYPTDQWPEDVVGEADVYVHNAINDGSVRYHPVTLERGIDETVEIRVRSDFKLDISVRHMISVESDNTFVLPSVTPFLVGDTIYIEGCAGMGYPTGESMSGPYMIASAARVEQPGTTQFQNSSDLKYIVNHRYEVYAADSSTLAPGVYTAHGEFSKVSMERAFRITRNSSLMYLLQKGNNYCFCGDGGLILDNLGIHGKKSVGYVRLLSLQENENHIASNVAGNERTATERENGGVEVLRASTFANSQFAVNEAVITDVIDPNNGSTFQGTVTTSNNKNGMATVRLSPIFQIGKISGVFPRLATNPHQLHTAAIGVPIGSPAYTHQNESVAISTVQVKSTALFAATTETINYTFEWDHRDFKLDIIGFGDGMEIPPPSGRIEGRISLSVDAGSVCKLVNENDQTRELVYLYTGQSNANASPVDLFTFHITSPLTMLPLETNSYKIGVSTDTPQVALLTRFGTNRGSVKLSSSDGSDISLNVDDQILFAFTDYYDDTIATHVANDLDISPRGPFTITGIVDGGVTFDTLDIHGDSSPLVIRDDESIIIQYLKYDPTIMRDIGTTPTMLTDHLRCLLKSNLDGKMEILVQSRPPTTATSSSLPDHHQVIVMETKTWGSTTDASVVVPFSRYHMGATHEGTYNSSSFSNELAFLPITIHSSTDEALVVKFYKDDSNQNIPYRSDFTLSDSWSDATYTATAEVTDSYEETLNLTLVMTVANKKPSFAFPGIDGGFFYGAIHAVFNFYSEQEIGSQALTVRVEYLDPPALHFPDTSPNTFSVICQTPEIIQHVELRDNINYPDPSSFVSTSHIEETAPISGSQVTVSLQKEASNVAPAAYLNPPVVRVQPVGQEGNPDVIITNEASVIIVDDGGTENYSESRTDGIEYQATHGIVRLEISELELELVNTHDNQHYDTLRLEYRNDNGDFVPLDNIAAPQLHARLLTLDDDNRAILQSAGGHHFPANWEDSQREFFINATAIRIYFTSDSSVTGNGFAFIVSSYSEDTTSQTTNIQSLWNAWGRTYQPSTNLSGNSVPITFELTGTAVDGLFGVHPDSGNTRNTIQINANGDTDDNQGSALDTFTPENSVARFGGFTTMNGTPSEMRIVSYYTERIRDHADKTIDQIEIEVAADIAASLSALYERVYAVAHAFESKGKIVYCMLDAEVLQIQDAVFRMEDTQPNTSTSMTYKITLDNDENDVHINFINLQKMAGFDTTTGDNFDFGMDMPLSVWNSLATYQDNTVLSGYFFNNTAAPVATGINSFFAYVAGGITTANGNTLTQPDIGYAYAEGDTTVYVTMEPGLGHVPVWFNGDGVTVEALYGDTGLMQSLISTSAATYNSTSLLQGGPTWPSDAVTENIVSVKNVLLTRWVPALREVCDVKETNVSNIVDSYLYDNQNSMFLFKQWINTRGKPITVVSPGYSDVLTSPGYGTLLTFHILDAAPDGFPGLEDPLPAQYGLGSYGASANYDLTPTYHAIESMQLTNDDTNSFRFVERESGNEYDGIEPIYIDAGLFSLRMASNLSTGTYTCSVKYIIYEIPVVTSENIFSNDGQHPLTKGMLPFDALEDLHSNTTTHTQTITLDIVATPILSLLDYGGNTVHLPGNRTSNMTPIKVSLTSGDSLLTTYIDEWRLLANDDFTASNLTNFTFTGATGAIRYIQVSKNLPDGVYKLRIQAFGPVAIFETGHVTLDVTVKVGTPVPATDASLSLKIFAANDGGNSIHAVNDGTSYQTTFSNSNDWPIHSVLNLNTSLFSFNTDDQMLTLNTSDVSDGVVEGSSTKLRYKYFTYTPSSGGKHTLYSVVPFPLTVTLKRNTVWFKATTVAIDSTNWYTAAVDMTLTQSSSGNSIELFTDTIGLVSTLSASNATVSKTDGTWYLHPENVFQTSTLTLTFDMNNTKFTGDIPNRYLVLRTKAPNLALTRSYPQTTLNSGLNNTIVSHDHTHLYTSSSNGQATEVEFDVDRPIIHFAYYKSNEINISATTSFNDGPENDITLDGEDLVIDTRILVLHRTIESTDGYGTKTTKTYRLDRSTNRAVGYPQKEYLYQCSVNDASPFTQEEIRYREQILLITHEDSTGIQDASGMQSIYVPNGIVNDRILFQAKVTPRVADQNSLSLTRIVDERIDSQTNAVIDYRVLQSSNMLSFSISHEEGKDVTTITCRSTDTTKNIDRGLYYLSYTTNNESRTIGAWWSDPEARTPSFALMTPVLTVIRTNLNNDTYAMGTITQHQRLVRTMDNHPMHGGAVDYRPPSTRGPNLHTLHGDKLTKFNFSSSTVATLTATFNGDDEPSYTISAPGSTIPSGTYYFVPVEDFDTLGTIGIMNMGGKFVIKNNGSTVPDSDAPTALYTEGTLPSTGSASIPVYCVSTTSNTTTIPIKRVESLAADVTTLRFVGLDTGADVGYVYDALVMEQGDLKYHRMVFGFSNVTDEGRNHNVLVEDTRVYYDMSVHDSRGLAAGATHVGSNGSGNLLFRQIHNKPRHFTNEPTEYIVCLSSTGVMPHEDYKKVYWDVNSMHDQFRQQYGTSQFRQILSSSGGQRLRYSLQLVAQFAQNNAGIPITLVATAILNFLNSNGGTEILLVLREIALEFLRSEGGFREVIQLILDIVGDIDYS